MVKYTLWGNDVDLDLPKETFPTDDEIQSIDEDMSNCEHGYFDGSTRHSKKLHYRKWTPTNSKYVNKNPKGICVFHHGIHGQSGEGMSIDGKKYGSALFVEFLIGSGYILYSLDMLGHGYSEGERYYIPQSDWSIGRDDLRSFAMFAVGQEDPKLPFFLMGESYGGCLVLHVARQWMDEADTAPSNFRGICMLSPAILGDLPPPPLLAILIALAYLIPRSTPFFMPDTVGAERTWKNPKVRKAFMDPHHREMYLKASDTKFCLGTALGLLNATNDVRSDVIPGLCVPFYVAHGTKDYGVPSSGTEYLVEHCATKEEDRCVRFVEEGYHTLLCEDDRLETLGSLIDWMDSRLSKSAFF